MTSGGVKPWWKSRTIWAALGVFLITIAPELGLSSEDATGLGGAVGDIVTGALALAAIVGRLRARDRIGAPGPDV
jgi:crotonobetainyl-CoA:carnitine CoA-transferase CaiB-like acyl-CoA transferase